MRFYPEDVPGPDGRDEARDQGEPRRRAGGWGIAASPEAPRNVHAWLGGESQPVSLVPKSLCGHYRAWCRIGFRTRDLEKGFLGPAGATQCPNGVSNLLQTDPSRGCNPVRYVLQFPRGDTQIPT